MSMRNFASAAIGVTLLFGPQAFSQSDWVPPEKWPSAPDDWIEFAPGASEADYKFGYLAYISPAARMGAKPNKGFNLKDPVPAWMNTLETPLLPTQKCCGPADGYEVEILKDGGKSDEWVARVNHGEAREYPDHTFRPRLPTGTIFHVRPSHVTKAMQGNPTGTAWIFAAVSYHSVVVYCLVPLPPSL
jgi:hypothetical protein